ncbi:nitrilotriacetate monooxygenase component B [Halalkalibacter wakoensis JCM 9140]|uniref:Nitrilotriacetate monooxygenase component B n=1 Tax=Halalkalibacter wakoensis JCM 9140 TaxID=1236970 RepID=W4Q195_9BACI|nr:nitrilotriacetate monooxygenase component B [Halalkalibacter wakoensis JCM 9140]
MKAIDPNNLGERENYHFLTGVIIPRPVAFVTTVSKYSNVLNGAPFSYFNIISSNPPLISISVQRKKGR